MTDFVQHSLNSDYNVEYSHLKLTVLKANLHYWKTKITYVRMYKEVAVQRNKPLKNITYFELHDY